MRFMMLVLVLISTIAMAGVVDGSYHTFEASLIDITMSTSGYYVDVGIDYIDGLMCYIIMDHGNYLNCYSFWDMMNNASANDLELIGASIGCVAETSENTSWVSHYLYILFEDAVVKISTADARASANALDRGDDDAYATILIDGMSVSPY